MMILSDSASKFKFSWVRFVIRCHTMKMQSGHRRFFSR